MKKTYGSLFVILALVVFMGVFFATPPNIATADGAGHILLAKSKNPCNPCAANPCATNPCGAKNPCAANPCAANPCNPCGAKNPCAANPCAANPCNPCGAKNPCAANPCGAKNPCAANPCNPCGASNVCNPCAGANPPLRDNAFKNRRQAYKLGKGLWKDASLGTSGLSCDSCHHDGAQLKKGKGSYFPRYVAMPNDIVTLDQMINYCVLNPLKGKALSWDSRELTALSVYYKALKYKSKGKHGKAMKRRKHKNPCNPCAGVNPCSAGNPCAPKNPCNPCSGS